MAASPTPRPKRADRAANPALAALERLAPATPVAVAFSGGADSTALLLAAHERWPGGVHALHVHHGLQAAADGFEHRCADACASLGIPLHVRRVDARHSPGESPEEAARQARYAELAGLAKEHGLQGVLLGHHADDQVETVLLALSRGAGLPGLAAMAPAFERHGVQFLRPLLQVPARDLRQWLVAAGVAFIDDPSNADTGFTRNRIRHRLLPALEEAFPQFRETFARSARHAAQAQQLLSAVAEEDLGAMQGEPLLARLRALPRARQANLLRHWLRVGHGVAPSSAQLDELLAQVAACATRGHDLRIKVAGGFVERDGDRLRYRA